MSVKSPLRKAIPEPVCLSLTDTAAPPADVVDKQAAALLEAQEKRGAEGGKLGGVLLEGWAGMPMNERILEHHPNIEVTRASPQNISPADRR